MYVDNNDDDDDDGDDTLMWNQLTGAGNVHVVSVGTLSQSRCILMLWYCLHHMGPVGGDCRHLGLTGIGFRV